MIKKFARIAALAAVAAGVNLTALVPAEAGPVSPVANGRRCSFASITDPQVEGEVQSGQINGGPLAAASPTATITITCTIQVGAANATHAGGDSCVAANAATPQVTTLPPTLCSYNSPEGQPVFMCTEIMVGGTTWYWDATVVTDDPVDQLDEATGWVNVSSALCNQAISQEIFPGPFEPALLLIDEILCPEFGTLAPGIPGIIDILPEGDIYLFGDFFWDCEPYDNETEVDGAFLPGAHAIVISNAGGTAGVETAHPSGFDCTTMPGATTTVTCTPDSESASCVLVGVVVDVGGTGSVTGESDCEAGSVAATAIGPVPGLAANVGPGSGPTWTCSATEGGGSPAPWQVTCYAIYTP